MLFRSAAPATLELTAQKVATESQVIETVDKGNINWTTQTISAEGEAIIDLERYPNPAQAKLMARRGAVVVAQRNLLEIIQGVEVVGETTVEDFSTKSDIVISRVKGVVRGATQVGKPIEDNGTIKVTLQIPMYGQKGIANAVKDEAIKAVAKQYGKAEATNPFANPSKEESNKPSASNESIPEKIAFNLQGQTFNPSMFPVVLDDKGNVQFDFSKYYQQTGKMPQIVKESKALMQMLGVKKGVEILDVVEAGKGVIKLTGDSQAKVSKWAKFGQGAWKVGKALLSIIL